MTANDTIDNPMEYRDVHNVYPALCPFKYRTYHPYELITSIREMYGDRLNTKESFAVHDLMTVQGNVAFNTLSRRAKRMLLAASGSWILTDNYCKRHQKFVNPRYHHLHTVTDLGDDAAVDNLTDRRTTWIQTARELQWDLDDIGIRMGFDASDVRAFADQNDIDLQQLLDDGLTTLARTWATAIEWGTPISLIASAFDLRESAVENSITMKTPGFEPPEDPSNGTTDYSV